jgi:hypothetical protein
MLGRFWAPYSFIFILGLMFFSLVFIACLAMSGRDAPALQRLHEFPREPLCILTGSSLWYRRYNTNRRDEEATFATSRLVPNGSMMTVRPVETRDAYSLAATRRPRRASSPKLHLRIIYERNSSFSQPSNIQVMNRSSGCPASGSVIESGGLERAGEIMGDSWLRGVEDSSSRGVDQVVLRPRGFREVLDTLRRPC